MKLSKLKNLFRRSKKELLTLHEEEEMVDLRKYILPIVAYDGTDYVVPETSLPEMRERPTDYAVANGAMKFESGWCYCWPRDNNDMFCCTKSALGIVPAMHLALAAANVNRIDKTSHTIEFGYYPKTAVHYDLDENLSEPTEKKYLGYVRNENANHVTNTEYKHEYGHLVYARMNNDNKTGWSAFDSEFSGHHNYACFKVEPIRWVIKNWDEMPQTINPNGNGRAQLLDVRAERAIIGGVPYYPNETNYVQRRSWANSTIRDYLNGTGRDFAGHCFLQDAFVVSKDLLRMNEMLDEDGLCL